MADERDGKLFGYALVTWLLMIWAARRGQNCEVSGTVASSGVDAPSWTNVQTGGYVDDPDNEG